MMRLSSFLLFTIVLILSVANCQQKQRIAEESNTTIKKPVSLHVDIVISGIVLGKKLMAPAGIAGDRHGNLYLTDSGNNRLIKFDSELNPTRDIGGHGSDPGLFDQPGFVTLDNNLNLLVSDRGNRRICRHDSNLEYVYEISLFDNDDPFKFGQPTGVALTGFGEVWIADKERNRLAIFDNVGRFDRMVGDYGYDGGELSEPQKILMDKDRFLVCDAGGGRIVVYDEFGNYMSEYSGSGFVLPRAITIDKYGLLWVLDAGTISLICIDKSGMEVFRIGAAIVGSGLEMRSPSDITFLRDGRLVITDTGNNRLLICQIQYLDEPN